MDREFPGAPGRTRTPDPLLRRQPLYPAELPGRGRETSAGGAEGAHGGRRGGSGSAAGTRVDTFGGRS